MTRPKKTRPIILKCTCGKHLQAVNAAGENFVSAKRECDCGLRWAVELEFNGWNDLGGKNESPNYKVRNIANF